MTTLKGILLGLSPIVLCLLLYLLVPYMVDENPGSLLSFAVMGLYVLSSFAVFITSIVLMFKSKSNIGTVSILTLAAQGIAVLLLLMS